MNKFFIIGNLTKEVESDTTVNGISVAKFTVAVRRRSGEETDFFPVVAWRGQAENCAKYLSKGSKVAVSGSVQIRHYEAGDGSRRYVTEVIADEVEFLSKKEEEINSKPQIEADKSVSARLRKLDIDEQTELPF